MAQNVDPRTRGGAPAAAPQSAISADGRKQSPRAAALQDNHAVSKRWSSLDRPKLLTPTPLHTCRPPALLAHTHSPTLPLSHSPTLGTSFVTSAISLYVYAHSCTGRCHIWWLLCILFVVGSMLHFLTSLHRTLDPILFTVDQNMTTKQRSFLWFTLGLNVDDFNMKILLLKLSNFAYKTHLLTFLSSTQSETIV